MPSEVEARLERILGDYLSLERRLERMERYDSPISVPWTDYSSTSTIDGWSSFDAQYIFYERNGDLVHVEFDLSGVSDDTVATFTLPYTNSSSINVYFIPWIMNNGTYALGIGSMAVSSATVSFNATPQGGAFTNSGTKRVRGQFWYRTTDAP